MPTMLKLPWPPKELTPNFKRRNHWTKYYRQIKHYRFVCRCLVLESVGRDSGLTNLEAVSFHPPDNRRRDDDGVIGAFKAGRDGIADALGVDDHTFKPTYEVSEPVRGGAVMVVLR